MAELQIPTSFGTLPLQANTGFWSDQLKAQADRKKAESDLRLQNARIPGVEADSTIRSNEAKLSTVQTGDAILADGAAKIDPADPQASLKWERLINKSVAAGYDDAEQWRGYSPAKQDRVVKAYSAKDAAGSLAAMSSGGMAPAGDTGDLTQQIANLPPEQIKTGMAKVGQMKQALIAVQNSPDPSKAWDAATAAFGKPELAGRYGTDFQSMWQHVTDMDAAFRSVADRTDVGLPGAPDDTKIVPSDGNLYAVDPTGPGNQPAVKPLTNNGDYSFVGTDEGGSGVYMNRRTGQETKGGTKLEAKPGAAGGRQSVFEKKMQAWTDLHPDDPQGALDYANGSKGILTSAQAMKAAQAQASRDLNALALSGAVIEDQQGFLSKATQEHYADLMSAQAPAAGGGGKPAGGGATAPDDELAPQRTHVGQVVDRVIDRIAALPQNDKRRFGLEQQTKELVDKLPPMKNPGATPPPRVVSRLREGLPTVFPNTGQGWTLRNGKPVRLW